MLAEDSEIQGTILNNDINPVEEFLKKGTNTNISKVVEQPCIWQHPTIDHLHKSFCPSQVLMPTNEMQF